MMRLKKVFIITVISLLLMTASIYQNDHAAYASSNVPGQFIAKMYTEALGRAPDSGGWQSNSNYFAANGCSSSTLRFIGKNIYKSTEFNNLYNASGAMGKDAKVLALYRGVLNREPDAGGFGYWRNQIDVIGWNSVVDSLFASTEFNNLVSSICSGNPYYWGTSSVITIPGKTSMTGSALQNLLWAKFFSGGGEVLLSPMTVVRVTDKIIIPTGVTLKTTGNLTHNQYALMARLVRESGFSKVMVEMRQDSKLKGIWVDGRDSVYPHSLGDTQANVLTERGGIEIQNNRISDATGGTHLVLYGSHENRPCASGVLVKQNLITGYANSHYGNGWADGITIKCENSTVEYNDVVDATDVGIIVFWAYPATQQSKVKHNVVINAGNSGYGSYGIDTWRDASIQPSFAGTQINNNSLWTSPTAHSDIALIVGTKAWHGNATNKGTGAQVSNNTSEGQILRTTTAIMVSGMLNATVQGNNFPAIQLGNYAACPMHNVVASVGAGWASGSIQSYTDVDVNTCIGH
ncbi:MAG: DUF4214 domain-containing protein [Chloroflexota bacterium]